MGNLTGGVPGRSRSELGLFKKDGVFAPALMAEVIGEAAAHHPSADNDDPCVTGQLFWGHRIRPVHRCKIRWTDYSNICTVVNYE